VTVSLDLHGQFAKVEPEANLATKNPGNGSRSNDP